MAQGHRALQNVSITSSATLIVPDNPNRCEFSFRNNDASASIYVGGSGVTSSGASKGLEVKAGEVYWDAKSPFALYGVTASGTVGIGGSEVCHVY